MIEIITENDIEQLSILEKIIFTSPWKEEDFHYEISSNEFSTLYKIEDEGNIVAYGGLWCIFDQAQITTLGTIESHRKQGLARKLMDHMISVAIENDCETMTLEVRVSNVKAIALYESFGFEIVSTRESYYSDNNEDAYLMFKAIGGLKVYE